MRLLACASSPIRHKSRTRCANAGRAGACSVSEVACSLERNDLLFGDATREIGQREVEREVWGQARLHHCGLNPSRRLPLCVHLLNGGGQLSAVYHPQMVLLPQRQRGLRVA